MKTEQSDGDQVPYAHEWKAQQTDDKRIYAENTDDDGYYYHRVQNNSAKSVLSKYRAKELRSRV